MTRIKYSTLRELQDENKALRADKSQLLADNNQLRQLLGQLPQSYAQSYAQLYAQLQKCRQPAAAGSQPQQPCSSSDAEATQQLPVAASYSSQQQQAAANSQLQQPCNSNNAEAMQHQPCSSNSPMQRSTSSDSMGTLSMRSSSSGAASMGSTFQPGPAPPAHQPASQPASQETSALPPQQHQQQSSPSTSGRPHAWHQQHCPPPFRARQPQRQSWQRRDSVDINLHKRSFILQAPQGAVAGPARPLAVAVLNQLQQFWPANSDGSSNFSVSDCVPLSPRVQPSGRVVDRFLLTVPTRWEADIIVRQRRCLKDTGYVLLDALTPQEQAAHDNLWPVYLDARSRGLTAQFNRARLFINGREQLPYTKPFFK